MGISWLQKAYGEGGWVVSVESLSDWGRFYVFMFS